MRRAAAAMLGMGALVACNLVTGVSDLSVGAVEAGVVQEPDADIVPLPPPAKHDAGPTDAGGDVEVDAFEAGPTSNVTMTITNTPNSVNLTTEGTIDWMEWGEDGTVTPSRKVGGTDIDDFLITGTNAQLKTLSDSSYLPAEAWNNGAPHANDNGNHEAGFTYGADDTVLLFKAKSAATPRSYALYVSAVRTKATIEATFGDGRAAAAPQIIDAPVGSPQYKRVLFTFSSADAAKLEIRYKVVERYDTSGDNARLGFHCSSLF